ncbi:uncharacterized protein LOC144582889 isoform X2 [Callithrix jacchus]
MAGVAAPVGPAIPGQLDLVRVLFQRRPSNSCQAAFPNQLVLEGEARLRKEGFSGFAGPAVPSQAGGGGVSPKMSALSLAACGWWQQWKLQLDGSEP